MRKSLSSCLAILWACTLFLSCQVLALETSQEIDIENIKPPQRDIKDILKFVETFKQNSELEDKAKKILEIPTPSSSDAQVLNAYYYRRASAYETLGNAKEAAELFKKVVNEYPSKIPAQALEELYTYAFQESSRGNYLGSNEILLRALAIVPPNMGGWRVSIAKEISFNCSSMGDIECAQSWLDKLENYRSSLSTQRNINSVYRISWDINYDRAKAFLYLREGKFIEAERLLRQALKNNKTLIDSAVALNIDALDNETRVLQDASTNVKGMYGNRISILNALSKSLIGQKKLIDAEYYAREAVILSVERYGINSYRATTALLTFAQVISEEGRQSEAALLATNALKIAQNVSAYPGSPLVASTRKVLGGILVADGKYAQATRTFSEMVDGVRADPEIAAKYQLGDLDWAIALVKTGKASQAVAMTSAMLTKESAGLDENSAQLAMLRAFHASALQASGQSAQALIEFKKSIPIIVDQLSNDVRNSAESIRQTQRITFVLEEYLSALSEASKSSSSDFVAEAFQIAEFARGSGVQRALTSSAARANIADPQLASLARREQDLQQRINALTELLIGLLSAAPDQQLPSVQNKIRSDISAFKSQREDIKKEIDRKFPDYAELVEPKPASVDRTQKSLKSDEVLVSWYFGDKVGYVWAITKDKPVLFAQIPVARSQIAKEVTQLRKALDPGVATIDEIPPFDVALAYQLYQQILGPVSMALSDKKILITVPHAELGQIPLSLLVTKQALQPAKGGTTAFIGYRSVPWLTRDIAVSQVPSVTALTALRLLPAGDPNRKNFIGFGDPYFSGEQEKTAEKQIKLSQLSTRGVPLHLRSAPKTSGVSSAELALLPRLPDTSTELAEVGKAIGANDDDIFLHQQASVKQVMSTDLSNRKVVMFATHGLVPGELNGLTQPALALSSPEVTGDKDDGLLTMDKVLTLKLNADWVILSACNTASGEGSGAEAVSGLGRAFFFAGSKALLVSNWPVDSTASRMLMTDLFKYQQQSSGASKAELLRQSMLNQIDQGGMKEGGNMKYAYAHPLFWAPFAVVGD